MKQLISAVLALLERSGIPYCVLHGWERLGESPASDVDLAIRPQDLGRVERLLHGQQDPSCVQLLKYKSTGYCFTLVSSGGQALRFLRLDLTTYYGGHGRLFMSAAELLAGRRFINDIWVASPAVELSYLLVKKVLKGAVPSTQKQRLRILVEQLGLEAAGIAARYFGGEQSQRLLSWISRGEWKALEENLPVLRRSLLRLTLLRNPSRWPRYWLPEFWRLWRRWLHPAGLFVAVLGPDGSGKSTLLRRLPAILRPAFPKSAVFHLRPGLLRAARNRGRTDDPHGKEPRTRLASLLKLMYLILDCGLGYLLKVRPQLARASLVCFDRYFHDLLADPLRYRHSGPSWLLRAACWLVPEPDLFLVLDVPAPELLRRKQEVLPAEAARQRAAYRGLAAGLPNAVLLPAESSKSLGGVRAAEAILSYLRYRYGRRRHHWFPSSRGADWDWLAGLFCANSHQSAGQSVSKRLRRKEHWRFSLRDGRAFLFPLIPRRAAVVALRLYAAQSLKARVARKCLAVGLATGLLQPLLPRLEAEAGGAGGDAFLPDHLKQVLGRQDLEFAISLGTPSAHRKPVIQVLEKSGRSLAYAKIGWNQATCDLVGNEAEALRSLGGKSLHGLQLPALLHLGRWHGRLVCLQSSPPMGAREAGRDLEPGYLEALCGLASLGARHLPLGKSVFWTSLEGRLGQLESGWPGNTLREMRGQVAHRLGGLDLPFHFCHGDFVPWNALVAEGRFFLFDWEYARTDWLPGYDLLHFLVQTRLRLGGIPPARVYRSVLEQSTRSAAIRAYWEQLGIQEASLSALLLLYLLERAVYHAHVNPAHYPPLQKFLALVQLGLANEGRLP